MNGMDGGPLASLERYLDATAESFPPDLVERIGARLLLEPPSTAPRRFLAALRALDARGILRGLGQNATTAFTSGRRSLLLRVQAMAVVLLTIASIGFGSVAGLAATQHVAQCMVEEIANRSSEGSITSPAAPAAPMAPTIEQPKVQPAGDGPGGPGDVDQPGSVEAPGQACGLPAQAAADHLQGSDGERCPDASDDAAADQRKADPPAAKGSDQRKADPPAAKASDKRKADPPARETRASDEGAAPVPGSKERPERRRDRDQ